MKDGKPMDVRGIVEAHIKESGFDGIYNSDGECACIPPDIMPCHCEGIGDCELGYRVDTPEGEWDYVICSAAVRDRMLREQAETEEDEANFKALEEAQQ